MAGMKFGFKMKIVENYQKLFDKKFYDTMIVDKNESDFWNEFFLLKANPIELDKIIKNQLNSESMIRTLFDKCNLILKNDDKLKQLNSILTLYVIMMINLKQSKKIKLSNNQPIILNNQLESMIENLIRLIDVYSDDVELIKLIMKIFLLIICKDDELNDNDQIQLFINDRLFNQLIKIISNPRKHQQNQLNQLTLIMITLIQNYRKDDNLFTVKLSLLENEIALNSYAQIISKEINDFNQQYRKEFLHQSTSTTTTNQNHAIPFFLFSALSGLVLSGSNQTEREQNLKFEQILIQTDSRPILLALYDMIHLNRNFIPFLLTNHSNGNEDGETNNLLINFLEFCSILILCHREYFLKDELLQRKLSITIKLCFIILTCIIEDQMANSIMHDSTNVYNKVQIHRSKMRHRPSIDCNQIKSNRPIAYSILDLMIEFLVSNLRTKHFQQQIDLYVFCNNIILKLICYQIKFECRKEYAWNDLWHSLFCLLRYLTVNYDKSDELQIKRKSRMLLLANNIINLFNLTVIFGDTFLHSPNDYDNLYYELLRNHNLFYNLGQLAKHHSNMSKKKDEKDAAFKVLDSLDNIESIIGHFIGKINEIKNDSPLTEEQIRDIVRSNYDTLNIKVKDGLDIYENYGDKLINFKKKLIKKLIEFTRTVHLTNLDELTIEQQNIMQNLLLNG